MEISTKQNYISVLPGSAPAKTKETEAGRKGKAEDNTKSRENINASELNLIGHKDSILKELLGKRAALQVQMDQFEKDLKIDKNLKDHADKKETLLKEALSNQKEALRIQVLKEDLAKTFCVDEDSKEQKDLELLAKVARGKEALSSEELERFSQIGPITQYQKAGLELYSMEDIFLKRASDAADESEIEERTIQGIKLGLLKASPMVRAKEKAEEILAEVDKEIQQALLEELIKKVGDSFEIAPEDHILTKPQSLLQKKRLTKEDLKGLAVDEQI